MNGIRGIIYDCDGVLFESRNANLAYYNTVLNHFGEPPVEATDQAKAHLCHTAASAHVFAQLLGEERTPKALSLAAGRRLGQAERRSWSHMLGSVFAYRSYSPGSRAASPR